MRVGRVAAHSQLYLYTSLHTYTRRHIQTRRGKGTQRCDTKRARQPFCGFETVDLMKIIIIARDSPPRAPLFIQREPRASKYLRNYGVHIYKRECERESYTTLAAQFNFENCSIASYARASFDSLYIPARTPVASRARASVD